jgi:CHASE2 domain-containing sensor protein
MSPEWIPLLFAGAVIAVLLLMLRSREQSRRVTICRIVVIEAIYLSMAYLLLNVLEHPPAEAFLGSIIVAALAGAIPNRYYRKMAGEK